jgi:hypothetical protein
MNTHSRDGNFIIGIVLVGGDFLANCFCWHSLFFFQVRVLPVNKGRIRASSGSWIADWGSVMICISVGHPKLFITDPDPIFPWVPDPDPDNTFKKVH